MPTLISSKLTFQKDRGGMNQDSLYIDNGYQFILAPNRYRKLIGKTPYVLSDSALSATVIDKCLYELSENYSLDKFDNLINEISEHIANIKVCEPTLSSGLRMLALTDEETINVQNKAIEMMKSDWPEYADNVIGYEPHINMFDEILVWSN